MARTVERVFDPGAGPLRIRVYLPEGARETAPALVYLHGGGFTLFSIDTHDRLMREYAAAGGFAVVGVDSPLSPEHKYPVALDRKADPGIENPHRDMPSASEATEATTSES